ncbi:MAG: DUF6163 family protein [Xanthobacteraceae bacterium]|nr:DUF6163 family protein [Xanthobacteraceae bacterium]GIK80552.1 MAG: hypothetical protein BroJett024_16570 [Alphaproteobacteria bacterium]
MTDPIRALQAVDRKPELDPWTQRLILFLRAMAILSMLKGLYHWAMVLGVADGEGSTFETGPIPWQAATVFFAVIDLIAAVGLWLAAAWGGVVWLTAAISMAAVEVFFPQVFGGSSLVVMAEMLAIFAYVGLALMAGRARST